MGVCCWGSTRGDVGVKESVSTGAGVCGVGGAGRTVALRGGAPTGMSTSSFVPGCGCLPRKEMSIVPSDVLMRVEPS